MITIVIMEKANFSKLVQQAQPVICKLIKNKRMLPPGSIKSHKVVMSPGGSYKWWQPETEDESLLLWMSADCCRQHSPSCSPFQLPSHSARPPFLGWPWIMEIDYAVTSQIPLPRAWPHGVWLQVGQACLWDALLAGPTVHPLCGVAQRPTIANGAESLMSTGRMKMSCLNYQPSSPIWLFSPLRHLSSNYVNGLISKAPLKFSRKSWVACQSDISLGYWISLFHHSCKEDSVLNLQTSAAAKSKKEIF